MAIAGSAIEHDEEIARVRDRVARVVGGVVLNLAMLLLPAIAMAGRSAVADAATVAFLCLSAVFSAVELASCPVDRWSAPSNADARDLLARRLALLTCLLMLAEFIAATVEHALSQAPTQAAFVIAGASIMLAGIVLRYAAIRALGDQFRSEITAGASQFLVRHGPYRYLRHPSEVGLLFVTLGPGLLLSSRIGFALWLLSLPIALWRLRLENAALTARFGEEF